MATNNLTWTLKNALKTLRALSWKWKFSFWIREGTKKYIRTIASTKVNNILYLYFFELGIIGKHGKKNIEKFWKGPNFFGGNEGH
jgi:hypothetical protein